MRCAVVAQDLGHRCGYVEIPEGHPWHGKDYDDDVPDAQPIPEDATTDGYGMGGSIALLGGRQGVERFEHTMAGQVQAHGGLTYAAKGLTGVDKEGWWIGFDCAHLGDAKDKTIQSAEYRRIEREFGLTESGRVWTLDAVVTEVEKLAEQIPLPHKEKGTG